MALTTEEKQSLLVFYEDRISNLRETTGLSRQDIMAWINYVVTATESGLVAINNGSPEPAKSSLTLNQKRWIYKEIVNLIFKEVV